MVIIIFGLPGSGKSFFASKLAARLGAVHINSDEVRRALNALGKYALKDKLFIYKEMLKLTEQAIAEKQTVIVDATFYHHAMRNLFIDMAERKFVKIRFIYIKASEALIRERLKKNRVDSEADFDVYKKIEDQFEKATMRHLELESTNDNTTILLNRAIQYIKDK